MNKRNLKSNVIYRATTGNIYDEDNKKFNCYLPARGGTYSILDCWVCDKNGNIHPGYNASPVPVNAENIGRRVNTLSEE